MRYLIAILIILMLVGVFYCSGCWGEELSIGDEVTFLYYSRDSRKDVKNTGIIVGVLYTDIDKIAGYNILPQFHISYCAYVFVKSEKVIEKLPNMIRQKEAQ